MYLITAFRNQLAQLDDVAGRVANNTSARSHACRRATRERFTAKERDGETGLDYLGARYYMPAIGQWTAVDPLADQYPVWSPYNYFLNNPLEIMPNESLLDDIRTAVLAKYGNCALPTFFFKSTKLEPENYRAALKDIQKCFEVREDTDLNIDVSFVFMLNVGSRRWVLSLSMIGPYATVFRGLDDIRVSLVDAPTDDPDEQELFRILRRHSIQILPRDVLETPCRLHLSYVEPSNTRMYHALFTDTDPLPWVPVRG